MLRWAATAGIALLLALNAFLPATSIGRRGTEGRARLDVPEAVGRVGDVYPDAAFRDLDGAAVRVADFRGQRVLLTYERSVDW